MPLDVLGCTRATLMRSTSLHSCLKWLGNLFKMHRDGDRSLQLLIFNEEFLVSASHQLVLITSLPFVHTARRSYRLSDPVNNSDWHSAQLLDVASESFMNLTSSHHTSSHIFTLHTSSHIFTLHTSYNSKYQI